MSETPDWHPRPQGPAPEVPDYEGACISQLIPSLLGDDLAGAQSWLPRSAMADRIVLFVIDGLGWNQLVERLSLAPTLASLDGLPITSVCPTTTATAMTSMTTGTTPAEHGLIGYRVMCSGAVLNTLRWTIDGEDANGRIPPEDFHGIESFEGQCPPVVIRADLTDTPFSRAHLRPFRPTQHRTLGSFVGRVAEQVASGEPFVFCYYDGIDKTAHEYGLGDFYSHELRVVDDLVASLLAALPSDVTLLITADHGQVDVGPRVLDPSTDLLKLLSGSSGEGRFRWLHSKPGQQRALLAQTTEEFGHTGWVVSLDQVIDENWFGAHLSERARSHFGDVALVAREPVAYSDPKDTGAFELVSRHGSLTADEMWVPLLAGSGRR